MLCINIDIRNIHFGRRMPRPYDQPGSSAFANTYRYSVFRLRNYTFPAPLYWNLTTVLVTYYHYLPTVSIGLYKKFYPAFLTTHLNCERPDNSIHYTLFNYIGLTTILLSFAAARERKLTFPVLSILAARLYPAGIAIR